MRQILNEFINVFEHFFPKKVSFDYGVGFISTNDVLTNCVSLLGLFKLMP